MKDNAVDWKALAEALLLLALAVMLWACVPADDQMAEGGIGGTGISSGPISGFGSIIVNGVHFDVSDAEIFVEDIAVAEEALQPGMIVTVYSDMDVGGETGRASRVIFSFDLIAVIDEITADHMMFIAQGQRVLLDEMTVLDGHFLAELAVGDQVYVSGQKDSSGDLLARYIGASGIQHSAVLVDDSVASLSEDESANEIAPLAVKLTGSVDGLNRLDQRFMLGLQVIDYSQAGFPDASVEILQDGASIWLEGRVEDDVLVAAQIKLTPELDVTGRGVLLDGLVTRVILPDKFELQGLVVRFDETTFFVDGDASTLAEGLALVVRGEASEEAIVASELRFKSPSLIQYEGIVMSISGDQILLVDSSVTVVAATLMLDRSRLALRRFSVADIRSGDRLNVFGYQSDEGVVLTRLERVD